MLKLDKQNILMLHAIADGHREAVLVSRRVGTKSSPGERRKQRGQPDRGDVYCSRAGNRVGADVFIDCVFLRYFLVIEHYLTIKCVVYSVFLIHGRLLRKKPRCDSHGLSKTFVESTSEGSDVDTGWMGLGNVPFRGDDLT